jgi:hypothetical protein
VSEARTAREIAERASWRDPEVLISVAVFVLWAAGFFLTYLAEPAVASQQAIGQMQGVLNAAFTAVIGYWIGSSRGSRRSADRADRAVDMAVKVTEEKK